MSNPYRDLQRLLDAGRPPESGTVVTVASTSMQVSTAAGLRTVRREAGDVTRYQPGDRIRISGDTARGRLLPPDEVYVL